MSNPKITTILNLYRRSEYLKEQIDAIEAQSVPTDKLWLWVNSDEDNFSWRDNNWNYPEHGMKQLFDNVVISEENLKYHGRFALALLAQTEYVAIFDDDTIPGKDWFKNCLETMEKTGPAILGGAGVTLNSRDYMNHKREGWPNPTTEIRETDLVGHAWFFPRNVLPLMWLNMVSFDNGEDIQLAACAKMYGGIKSYTPPHDPNNKDTWSSLSAVEKGTDKKASSNGSLMPYQKFWAQRNAIVSHYIDSGWKTVKEVK